MIRPVLEQPESIGKWVLARAGGEWTNLSRAVGFMDGAELVAGAVFEGYTGPNIWVHLASDTPYAMRPLLRAIGGYCFNQLRCARLTLAAESSNLKAVELHQRLGAIHEGTLVGAGRRGDDILLSRLGRDCAIWRRLEWAASPRAQHPLSTPM